ncbi:MAG: FtsW/RodA/SpoVE family cell cycle protein, partial [Candidatus Colwellbacteria bacterium]|nr:FtsW/RodA/SpoVE family cell cycle protein [Candidatus Colwellbacteria bacterium]
LVFTPLGGNFGTASRWIEVGGIPIQPSEFLKITFIIYLAAWITTKGKNRGGFAEGLLPFILMCGVIGALLIAQPSTSILVVLLIVAGLMYFMGGLKFSFVAAIIGIAAIALGVIIISTPYRLERFTTFLNPEADIQDSGYHLNQSLMTIGSGGLLGVGYGKSALKSYLPEPMNDTIFAIIAEEFGFIGSIVFISLFFLLVMSGLLGSLQIRDNFGKLMLVGFSATIGVQSFIHIASVSGIMPMTGMPLPFISYGGTGIIAFMTIGGLMINILKNA